MQFRFEVVQQNGGWAVVSRWADAYLSWGSRAGSRVFGWRPTQTQAEALCMLLNDADVGRVSTTDM